MEHKNSNLITNSTKQNHLYSLDYLNDSNSSDNENEFLNYFMQKKINDISNITHGSITGGRIETKIEKKLEKKNENEKIKLSQNRIKHINHNRSLSSTNRNNSVNRKENNSKKINNISNNYIQKIIKKTHKLNNFNNNLKNHNCVNISVETNKSKNKTHISKNILRNKKNKNLYINDYSLTTPYQKTNKPLKKDILAKYINKKITNSLEKHNNSVKNKKITISNTTKNNKISKINYKNILKYNKKLFDTAKNLEFSNINHLHENTDLSNQNRKIIFTTSGNLEESRNNQSKLKTLNSKQSINNTQSYILANNEEIKLKNHKKYTPINYKKEILKINGAKKNVGLRLCNQEFERKRTKAKKLIVYRKQILDKSSNSIGVGEQNKTCKNNKIKIFCFHNKC